jgi:hypothetical protein
VKPKYNDCACQARLSLAFSDCPYHTQQTWCTASLHLIQRFRVSIWSPRLDRSRREIATRMASCVGPAPAEEGYSIWISVVFPGSRET